MSMTAQARDSTAGLAMAFGVSLMATVARAETTGVVDARTARELAVISRVLERRLGEMRKSMAMALATNAIPRATPITVGCESPGTKERNHAQKGALASFV